MNAEALQARIVVDRGTFRLDASFTVAVGEVMAVLGPNGAGKTTILRVLAGLHAVSAGHVRLGDDLWDDAEDTFIPAMDRRVGVVFQDYRLFPHLTVVDNVAFPLRARGARRAAARAAAAPWLDRVGLGDLAERRPGALSGGQAQRVALARALAGGPRLLLLDEPLAALDARTRLEIRSQLREHLALFAGPSVLVTHDPLEALVLADRVLVLEAGRVVQLGTPAEVARRPATEYVARLMGLNLYSGVLRDATNHRIELSGGGTLYAAGHDPDEASDGLASPDVGTAMLVAVAPSAISLHLTEPGPGSARNVWTGTVSGIELLTDRIRVALQGPPDALVDITPAAMAALELHPGTRVWLSAKASEVLGYPEAAATASPSPTAALG